MDISSVFKGWLYLGMIQRKVLERTDDGMYDRKSVREREHHGRNNGDRKKTESGEKFLKGHPGFGLSLRPPSHPSSFRGWHCQVLHPFTGVNRVNALNNYTDIPGKSVLSGNSNSSDGRGVTGLEMCRINVDIRSRQNTLFCLFFCFSLSVLSLWVFSLWWFLWWADQQSGKHTNRHRQATCITTPSSLHHTRCQQRAGCFSKESMGDWGWWCLIKFLGLSNCLSWTSERLVHYTHCN